MSATEITFAQYDAYTKSAKPSYSPNDGTWGRKTRPVIQVSWRDVQGYTNWLSLNNKHNLKCSLPSEAQWEYAARAKKKSIYAWGNHIGKNNANCNECSSKWDDIKTAPVAMFKANGFGLYDMHGNVSEWIKDAWHKNYEGAPLDGKAWVNGAEGNFRVTRGGSWDDKSQLLQSSFRQQLSPENTSRNLSTGFRVVCTPR